MIPVSIERNVMDINKTLYRVSKEIIESEITNPLLIGIPRRGDHLAKRISNNLVEENYSHDLDTVNYKPFRDDLTSEGDKTFLIVNPQDRDVILIDDVVYTGRTLRASIERSTKVTSTSSHSCAIDNPIAPDPVPKSQMNLVCVCGFCERIKRATSTSTSVSGLGIKTLLSTISSNFRKDHEPSAY